MKKLLSCIIAAAAAFTMGTAVFAETEEAETQATRAVDSSTAATFTFDTEISLDYVHTFGNAFDTNLTMEITDEDALAGKSVKLSESFDTASTNTYGGIYFDAADFGLDSWAGYTFKYNITVAPEALDQTDFFQLFSDGDEWNSTKYRFENADMWDIATYTVPADMNNAKVGISIPITEPFEGSVLMLDDITITDIYGETIANIGDLDTSLYQAPNTVISVLTTILFIVLILAVIAGVVYFILKVARTYR